MKKLILFVFGILSVGYFTSCTELEYPEEGSIEDKTPPKASFGTTVSDTSYQTIYFTNFSLSSTDYSWDFGNGQTSTEKNPSMNFADGRYLVTLTCSDKLNVTSTFSDSVIIVEPKGKYQPFILNPGFDIQGENSYKDNWVNRDLSESYNEVQITSDPVESGEKAAKLPSDGSREGYQEVVVEENTDYIISFYYTMETTPAGSLTVTILDGPVTDKSTFPDRTIYTQTFVDQVDAGIYTKEQFEFNSGPSTKVAIHFGNEGVETRVDTWKIDVK